jgi:hypothetical protein
VSAEPTKSAVASVQILENVLVVKRMMVNVAVMVAAKLINTTQKSAQCALLFLNNFTQRLLSPQSLFISTFYIFILYFNSPHLSP